MGQVHAQAHLSAPSNDRARPTDLPLKEPFHREPDFDVPHHFDLPNTDLHVRAIFNMNGVALPQRIDFDLASRHRASRGHTES